MFPFVYLLFYYYYLSSVLEATPKPEEEFQQRNGQNL